MFDRLGCGRESLTKDSLESEIAEKLRASGWETRADALVLDPELEIWVWSDSPLVDQCLGWAGKDPGLKTWLENLRVSGEPIWPANTEKPRDPKRAVEEALREARKPRSSALYAQLAETVSLARCSDPRFQRFRAIMTDWFGDR
jgi:hypothetical protein